VTYGVDVLWGKEGERQRARGSGGSFKVG
jgi:hypothetical protein